ncbi:M48 family metalloprotease [Actinoplanes sp. NPDC049265]|uniref:M48 family metalloprotease n=1 Tax=Actinoplanes sp. NPDC049265 TaxID=3363902 RepID=UPI003717EA3A
MTAKEPGTLAIRFLILLVLVLAATASIWGYLGLEAGRRSESPVAECLARTELNKITHIAPGGLAGMIGDTTPVLRCGQGNLGTILWSEVAGLLLVVGTALAAYRVTPWWLRRRGFAHLDGYDSDAAAEIRGLAAEYGLAPTPTIRLSRRDSSYVHGTGRHPVLFVSRATVRDRLSRPGRFTAIVRHELAHLRNRDNRETHLATTLWWSFLALALTPYLVLLIVEGLGPPAWRPAALASAHEDLHTTVAIGSMVTFVVLARLALLRSRELHADATAGRYDEDGLLARTLRDTDEAPGRRPVILRSHPPIEQRRRAVADPSMVSALSLAGLFGAGVGLSVLSQDAGIIAWQLLLTAGFDPVPSPMTTLVLVVAIMVANLGPIGALAWLIGAEARRARLRARRPPLLAIAVVLGLGMVVGEPAAVSSANVSRWGVFDGVGDGTVAAALVAALVLVAVIAAVVRWSWDNAGAWMPSARSARWGPAVATVAALPWYATWWAMHDTPLIGRSYLWTPDFADVMKMRYLGAPGAQWLQITYFPLAMLSWAPGVAVLLALPIVVTAVGHLRGHPESAGRLARAAARGCGALLVAGVAAAVAAYPLIGRAGWFAQADFAARLHYLMAAADALTVIVAAATAVLSALSHGRDSVTFGLVAALTVSCFGGVISPALMAVASSGPHAMAVFTSPAAATYYGTMFSLTGTGQPVKSIVTSMLLTGVALALNRLRLTIGRRRAVPVREVGATGAATSGSPDRKAARGVLGVTSMTVLTVSVLLAGAYLEAVL